MRDMACRVLRIWDIWGIWQAGYTDMKEMAGRLDIRIWRYGAMIGGMQFTDFMIAGYDWLNIACSRRLNCGDSAKRCMKENRLLVAHSTISVNTWNRLWSYRDWVIYLAIYKSACHVRSSLSNLTSYWKIIVLNQSDLFALELVRTSLLQHST